ncbi:MAG: hypothetical protein IJC15_00775 [Clostridia bacterium]|nr:hypothetical protein [Clostridia bacterium]
MATIRTRQAGAAVEMTQFGGLDRRGVVCDMVNFRPRGDGGLVRRCGFAPATVVEGQVRGVWSGSFGGEEVTFAAAGNRLYRLDLNGGSNVVIGEIAAGEGPVALFLWRGMLCCLDGEEIRLWDGEVMRAAEPYVPMVARDRGPTAVYEIDEPINLIGRRARFSFRADGENAVFYFGYAVESVVKLYDADTGVSYLNVEYRLGNDGYGGTYLAFNVVPAAGKRILAIVTLAAKYDAYARVAACCRAVVYGGSYDDRMLCWGGTVESEMFCSQPVSTAQIEEASIWGNSCGGMYFPADCNFRVGDGQYAITAACRHYDRLLIFTRGDTWMADFSSSLNRQFPVVPINSGVGCTAPGAAALAGNNPLTVADGAIWRWKSSALRRDECSAECVSGGLDGLISEQFSRGAVVYSFRGRNEVWFADPSDEAGHVLVYHVGLDVWYRFSGVRADGFFVCGGDVGFWRGNVFYRFDEARETDLDTDGEREIAAGLELRGLDFGDGVRVKHLTRLALRVEEEHPALTVELGCDLGRVRRIEARAGGTAGGVTLIDRVCRSGRFRRLSVSVAAAGRVRLRLCALLMTAEPSGKS